MEAASQYRDERHRADTPREMTTVEAGLDQIKSTVAYTLKALSIIRTRVLPPTPMAVSSPQNVTSVVQTYGDRLDEIQRLAAECQEIAERMNGVI